MKFIPFLVLIVFAIPSWFFAIMSVMLFDAPNSTKKTSIVATFVAIWGWAVICVVGVVWALLYGVGWVNLSPSVYMFWCWFCCSTIVGIGLFSAKIKGHI